MASLPPYATGQESVAATVTITATWNGTNYYGPPIPPPAKLILKLYPTAYWSGQGTAGFSITSHSADDGYKDLEVPDNSPDSTFFSGTSSAPHLITVDGSSGTVILTANLAVSVSGAASITGGSLSVDYACTATVDDRNVSIIDPSPTYHSPIEDGLPYSAGPRLNPQVQAGYVMRGDVWIDMLTKRLTYAATPNGPWSSNTVCRWSDSLLGEWISATLNTWPTNMITWDVMYSDLSGGQLDNITLQLTDPLDGAIADAYYQMHLHDQYEPASWPEDSGYPKKVMNTPDPEMPNWPTYPWQACRDNNGHIQVLIGPTGDETG
ncbi:MAG TPA: hypothetical protein VKU00_34055 [Chthonomonadaceae bacterium]|nr:hypothetical protein [Chthonomonadaceae bacterium]